MKNTKVILILGLILSLIQIFDIFVHVATNQAELIRIISNILIISWIVIGLFLKRFIIRIINYGIVASYLVLNALFILLEGAKNSNGEVRKVFFVLVISTLVLSIIYENISAKNSLSNDRSPNV